MRWPQIGGRSHQPRIFHSHSFQSFFFFYTESNHKTVRESLVESSLTGIREYTSRKAGAVVCCVSWIDGWMDGHGMAVEEVGFWLAEQESQTENGEN